MIPVVIFHYHRVNWCQLQIHAVYGPSNFMWMYTVGYQQGQLKLTYINFVILNFVMYFKFIKSTYFYAVKQKNWKWLDWLFWCKKPVSTLKWHLSENLIFQNLLKNKKLLPAEKFSNILAFDKESKRKLLLLISADSFIKDNLCLNGKFFDFKIIHILLRTHSLVVSNLRSEIKGSRF